MRVALDAGPLILTSGGLRRYVEELHPALLRAFPDDRFLFLSAADQARNWMERRWWLWGARKACQREKIDVFHGTNFEAPYRAGVATVVTLHDLSPWMEPSWQPDAARVRKRAPWMLKHAATMIVTPSEAVRRQAMERFGIAPARIVAIPHAASPWFRRVDVKLEHAFVFVGTLEPRKNIAGMVEAWRPVYRETGVKLRIAGRRRADFPALPPEEGLELLGEVPDDQLPALYSGALAVIYPSQYEGFGLPVLEAMQCGACVITSRDAAISEVAQGAAWQAGDAVEMREAMRCIAGNPALAQAWRERALARAAQFSWDRTAALTYAAYEEARARFSARSFA